MTCNQCGTALHPDARFCPQCGTAAPVAAAPPPPAAPATQVIPQDWQQQVPSAPSAPPGPAPATQAIPADWQKQVTPPTSPPAAPTPPSATPPSATPPWEQTAAGAASASRNPLDFLLPGAGAVALIASFLPWATVSFGSFSESASGTDNGQHGTLTALFGLVLIGLGVLRLTKGTLDQPLLIVAAVASLGILGIAVYDYLDVNSLGDDFREQASDLGNLGDLGGGGDALKDLFKVDVTVGFGLYLEILAGAAALAGTALAARKS